MLECSLPWKLKGFLKKWNGCIYFCFPLYEVRYWKEQILRLNMHCMANVHSRAVLPCRASTVHMCSPICPECEYLVCLTSFWFICFYVPQMYGIIWLCVTLACLLLSLPINNNPRFYHPLWLTTMVFLLLVFFHTLKSSANEIQNLFQQIFRIS